MSVAASWSSPPHHPSLAPGASCTVSVVGKWRAPTTGSNEDYFAGQEVWDQAIKILNTCVGDEGTEGGKVGVGKMGVFSVEISVKGEG